MRVFLAINLPESVVEALLKLQIALPAGNPVRPDNLHLTLVFMDKQPDELIEEAHFALQHLKMPKLELNLAGLDTFGSREPSILYVGVEKNEALDLLQEKVIGVLRSAGVLLGRKRFRPHVTIARFGHGLAMNDLDRLGDYLSGNADFGPVSFTVGSFSLYQSTLGRKGAVHDELAQYCLI